MEEIQELRQVESLLQGLQLTVPSANLDTRGARPPSPSLG